MSYALDAALTFATPAQGHRLVKKALKHHRLWFDPRVSGASIVGAHGASFSVAADVRFAEEDDLDRAYALLVDHARAERASGRIGRSQSGVTISEVTM